MICSEELGACATARRTHQAPVAPVPHGSQNCHLFIIFMWALQPGIFHVSLDLIPQQPWTRWSFLHLKDKGSEAPGVVRLGQGHTAGKWQWLSLNLRLSDLKPVLFLPQLW